MLLSLGMSIWSYSERPQGGWIQIGESRWDVARESREGFSPSGILATPRVRDSPIWIQPRGVFRINPTSR